MKKIRVSAFILLLCFSLFGCGKVSANDEKSNTSTADQKTPSTTVCFSDCINIDFNNVYVEIGIHTDESYYFSNRNEEFFEKFTAFLANKQLSAQEIDTPDAESFYCSVYDGKNQTSFSIYETDIIEIHNTTSDDFYRCANVYREFKDVFDSFLDQNREYCRIAETPVRLMYEYAIYDENDQILESDCISRTPHLFYNSGIVHLWVQSGTGTSTRWAKFYDVEKGLISPEYYGQTDFFGNMVCATESTQVSVYDMFSGEQIYCFNNFQKPLGDCAEKISSAYFSKDGTQIIVEYLNTEFETEEQVFDLLKDPAI